MYMKVKGYIYVFLNSVFEQKDFMPPDQMIGGGGGVFILFVCLLSTLTFMITFEP